ncbi:hypothetical protein [Streptomyces sp. ISL-94]|uniref:hypothetical protein n=1 Tax=Streptomyces sp. ISL-94 TaxID=2819190 RepID=UPI001BEC3E78|nr:hypothetical protein [Streptomyces sp. ISL-94]MBT2476836.1 hypothetical protein [Streptomyces sp. ISL-94]
MPWLAWAPAAWTPAEGMPVLMAAMPSGTGCMKSVPQTSSTAATTPAAKAEAR